MNSRQARYLGLGSREFRRSWSVARGIRRPGIDIRRSRSGFVGISTPDIFISSGSFNGGYLIPARCLVTKHLINQLCPLTRNDDLVATRRSHASLVFCFC